MSQNTEPNSMIENLIGTLLIIPMYIIIFVLLHFLNIVNFNSDILLPFLMYIPIIFGMFLSYKMYKDKTSVGIGICIFLFMCLAIYFYYNTYFIEYSGWDGLGYYIFWLGTTAICKILSCVFFGKIVGWKKAIMFLGMYILLVVLSLVFGFWA